MEFSFLLSLQLCLSNLKQLVNSFLPYITSSSGHQSLWS